MQENNYSSHSADVEMWLDCGEHGRLGLSRITPKSVVAKSVPQDIPRCRAELVVTVDGRQLSRWVDVLGFSRGRRVALVLPVYDPAPF
jgi:hypothetical protein